MAASDIELLTRCADFTLNHTQETEKAVLKNLDTSAATMHVNSLRMLRLQRAILAIGMFSLFESLLQDSMKWNSPFDELKVFLKDKQQDQLALIFTDYAMAINVLKHGKGRSYDLLLKRKSKLEFRVKPEDEAFFYEGDVSEVSVLVDADGKFVRRCAQVIEEVASILRSESDGHLI